jgi:hypothetical protein
MAEAPFDYIDIKPAVASRRTSSLLPLQSFFGIFFHLFFVLLEPFKHEQSLAPSMLDQSLSPFKLLFLFLDLQQRLESLFFSHRRVAFFVANLRFLSLASTIFRACPGVNLRWDFFPPLRPISDKNFLTASCTMLRAYHKQPRMSRLSLFQPRLQAPLACSWAFR